MRRLRTSITPWEWLVLAVFAFLALAWAVLPHAVDYSAGRGWGVPEAGLLLSLVGTAHVFALAAATLVLGHLRSPEPRRRLAVCFASSLLLVYFLVSLSFGGLAASHARGFADRLRYSTPLDSLQLWAARAVMDPQQATLAAMPLDVLNTLPPHPKVSGRSDHVVISWYNIFILAGPPEFCITSKGDTFFLEQIRPGIYLDVESY